MEIWEALEENDKAMVQCMKELRPHWNAWAKADLDYDIAKGKKITQLLAEDKPRTIINEMVRNDEDIAMLRYKSRIAEGEYRSNVEAVNVYKQREQTLRLYFEKEWSNTK